MKIKKLSSLTLQNLEKILPWQKVGMEVFGNTHYKSSQIKPPEKQTPVGLEKKCGFG